ncbi:helix-turn-helix transcriptional regulator [Reichenbachiella versicolor]|uniref:helix-turn-helix transcriptional regulator n=1 Tax=Reichenbachiella versicolor TaxID=1821036 RepID=UPI000D6E71C1|nr:hypothetical protein [Reichenbachiella versicolor]
MTKVFGTEMYLVTFLISVFEAVMLLFALFWFSIRHSDKDRLHYLFLLFTLLMYNVVSGLLPDDAYNHYIPYGVQVVLAYASGFCHSIYFPYYCYKVYDLKELKWIVFKLTFYLLILPFLLMFIVPYVWTGDLEFARKLTVLLPFIFGLVFTVFLGKSLYQRYIFGVPSQKINWINLGAVFLSLVFWCGLPVIVFFGDFQVIEATTTNFGFLLLTIVFIRHSIINSNQEHTLFEIQQKQVIQLQEELSSNKVELSNLVIKYSQGQATLETLKDQYFNLTPKERAEFPELTRVFKEGFSEDDEWKTFFESFDKTYNGFYGKLRQNYIDLSEKELRHIVYMKQGLSKKEKAKLLNVKESSIRELQYRIKKKISPPEGVDLLDYINKSVNDAI